MSTLKTSVVMVITSVLTGAGAAGAPGTPGAAAAAGAVDAGRPAVADAAALAGVLAAGACATLAGWFMLKKEGFPFDTIQLSHRSASEMENTIHRIVRLLISIEVLVRSGCNRKRP